ncbi:MAG: HU family DNA-binding protein [Oscillospiraceae bacterium]|nr:HU family DNA-binding protein [Oscillospiraceae bacterium]
MNKTELITAIAEASGLTKKDAESALNATVATITKALAAGDRVQLTGLGIFETKTRAARTGRNPLNGKTINIPASRVPGFKASKTLKDIVNK